MIFIHSDDYGVSDESSAAILSCIANGALNSLSIRANVSNMGEHISKLKAQAKPVRIALHLDLTEGKCVQTPQKLFLLTDADGYFKHGFISLWLKYIFASKKTKAELKKQVRLELNAQTRNIKKYTPFSAIDSHCHMHMIPFVFEEVSDIAKQENASLRIPYEPSLPFIKNIGLWFTYKPANIAKHVLLNILSRKHKRKLCFFGVMFSGKMDLARVKKILPEMTKKSADLEVLFHPCPAGKNEKIDTKNKKFEKYYKSPHRLLELETVKNINL